MCVCVCVRVGTDMDPYLSSVRGIVLMVSVQALVTTHPSNRAHAASAVGRVVGEWAGDPPTTSSLRPMR